MEQYQIVTLIIIQIWPVIMICLGVKFLKKQTKHNRVFLWYKITFAYKDPRAWDYIHTYCGKRLLWIGASCILLSAITVPFILFADAKAAFKATEIVLVIHFLLLVGTVIWANATLKEKFSKGALDRHDN